MGGAMAFVGCRLIKQCHNQLSVGVSGGGDFAKEETRPELSVWEDAVPWFETMIEKQKEVRIYQVVALDGRRLTNAFNNQPKAGILNRGEYGEGVWPGGSIGDVR